MRPLPSLVAMQTVPVSAMPKLQPLMPISALRNSLRRRARAALHMVFRVQRGLHVQLLLQDLADVFDAHVRGRGDDMAGRAPRPSWMMYSPRSVSTTVMPEPSSASLR